MEIHIGMFVLEEILFPWRGQFDIIQAKTKMVWRHLLLCGRIQSVMDKCHNHTGAPNYFIFIDLIP